MIDQIATRRNITSSELIQHSQTIDQTLREKSEDSKTLSTLSREISDVSRRLMQTVEEHRRQGVKVIVHESDNELLLDTKRVVNMLRESSNVLGEIAKKFEQQAQEYDNQLQFNGRLVNRSLDFSTLKTRVAACERQANSRLMDQKNYLQRTIPKIEDHEMTVEGFKGAIGLPADGLRLLSASKQMLESL